MPLIVPAMRSMWESAVMPKNERGGTDYDAKEGDVKLEPSLSNIKPKCCFESTHPSSPRLISCVDFRIEPYTKMAALAEWLRVGLWQLGEPFKYHGKVYYKIDRQNPPHFAIADADEGDPTGNETVVQMYAFLHDCEAGGCRMYVFSPANMEATMQ